MHKFHSIIFLIFLLICSCNSNNKGELNQNDHTKIFSYEEIPLIDGVRLHISDSTATPNSIEVINSSDSSDLYGVITDLANLPPLHYVNFTQDKYLAGIGREGDGPGEFRRPGSIGFKNRNEFFVLDNSKLTLTTINLMDENHLDHLHQSNPEIINLEFNGLPLDVVLHANGNYVAIGPMRTSLNKRFAILDEEGQQIELKGILPEFDEKIPPNVHQLSWRSYGTSNPDGTRFAFGLYHIDRIELYNADGELLEVIRGPDYHTLDYSVENGRTLFGEDTHTSYIDISSTEKYIYGLYSGARSGESNRNFGRYIHVFTWEGDFVKAFELDQYAFGIGVDSEDRLLFASVQSLEPGIYQYELDIN